jgi:hypothetical protein
VPRGPATVKQGAGFSAANSVPKPTGLSIVPRSPPVESTLRHAPRSPPPALYSSNTARLFRLYHRHEAHIDFVHMVTPRLSPGAPPLPVSTPRPGTPILPLAPFHPRCPVTPLSAISCVDQSISSTRLPVTWLSRPAARSAPRHPAHPLPWYPATRYPPPPLPGCPVAM